MKYFVTGGAGFIGSNFVKRILQEGNEAVVYDNFSTGLRKFLEGVVNHPDCRIVEGDLLDQPRLEEAIKDSDVVIHLAANADVRFGINHPGKDLEQNTIGTFHLLEAMRKNEINKIVFSSTGSVYGEAVTVPTPEDAEFPVQTSLYGASKLAGEGLITAYCEGFGIQCWIYRFVSVLGEHYSHGHVYDFFRKLKSDPTKLEILGNGLQRKSYMYVLDCIDGMMLGLREATDRVNIFNLGTDEYSR